MQRELISIEELSRGAVPTEAQKAALGTEVVKVVSTTKPADIPPVIPATEAFPVDLKNLMNSQGQVVRFSFRNNSLRPLIVYIGTCVGIDENWLGLGLEEPGNVISDFLDQFGAPAPKLRTFNNRVCYKGGIVVSEINVFADSASPARNISFEKVEIDLNANNCTFSGRVPVSDTQINGVFHKGLFPLSDSVGLRFTAPQGVAFELELVVLAESVPNLKRV